MLSGKVLMCARGALTLRQHAYHPPPGVGEAPAKASASVMMPVSAFLDKPHHKLDDLDG
jgi:hypothetical protein